MNLSINKISWATPDLHEVWRLYRASFPIGERIRLEDYLNDDIGTVELLGFYEDAMGEGKAKEGDSFVGFSIMMTYYDMTHILYFCIEETMRGKGYGSAALKAMADYYPGKRIMADLEDPLENVENLEERKRRIGFYEKNGYALSDVHYVWEGEHYVMMVHGGNLTTDDFEAFWDAANHDRHVGYERMEEAVDETEITIYN